MEWGLTAGDIREVVDRRRSPRLNRYHLFGGRRRHVRRETDRTRPVFVDLYSTRLFVALLALFVLSLGDAFLTLALMAEGLVIEANPFMAFFLGYGSMTFLAMKLFLTISAVLVFCVFKNFPLTRMGLPAAIVLYASVIVYQLSIWYRYHPGL
ncbi:MAG: hypothetical protein Kow0025_11380 [Thermodesulfovibrionales bacterium]